jgi:hypothetical protein
LVILFILVYRSIIDTVIIKKGGDVEWI